MNSNIIVPCSHVEMEEGNESWGVPVDYVWGIQVFAASPLIDIYLRKEVSCQLDSSMYQKLVRGFKSLLVQRDEVTYI